MKTVYFMRHGQTDWNIGRRLQGRTDVPLNAEGLRQAARAAERFAAAGLRFDAVLPRHALVCERHTGTGITVSDIRDQHLPLPLRDFSPVSVEEQLICYADKFFSKSRPDYERTPQQVLLSLKKFGSRATERILEWQTRFL